MLLVPSDNEVYISLSWHLAMAPSLKFLLPIFSLFVSHTACSVSPTPKFRFAFPTPGKNDYAFADGDKAVVLWAPQQQLPELWLNCGGNSSEVLRMNHFLHTFEMR